RGICGAAPDELGRQLDLARRDPAHRLGHAEHEVARGEYAVLCRLGASAPGPSPAPARRRPARQSQGPSRSRSASAHRSTGRHGALPAALLPRLQPDRAHVESREAPYSQARPTHRRRAPSRRAARATRRPSLTLSTVVHPCWLWSTEVISGINQSRIPKCELRVVVWNMAGKEGAWSALDRQNATKRSFQPA